MKISMIFRKSLALTLLVSIISCNTLSPINADGDTPMPPVEQVTPEDVDKAPNLDKLLENASKNAADDSDRIDEIQKKAALDTNFRAQLLADPKGVLKAEGISLNPQEEVNILEVTPDVNFMVLDDRSLRRFHGKHVDKSKGHKKNPSEEKLLNVRGKAQNDAALKARLLEDPSADLIAAGLPEITAQSMKVLDFEPNTHILILLPSQAFQEQTGDMQVKQIIAIVIDGVINAVPPLAVNAIFSAIAQPLWSLISEEKKQVFNSIFNGSPEPEFNVDTSVAVIGAICFWPNFFGIPCSLNRQQAAAMILRTRFGE